MPGLRRSQDDEIVADAIASDYFQNGLAIVELLGYTRFSTNQSYLRKVGDAMANSQGSKRKILLCARDLFYFSGYQTTSVDDILRVCGVAKSNFYYHFRSKDDLALAVMELHVSEFERTALAALRDLSQGPNQRFDCFCKILTQTQVEQHNIGGCPFGNFAGALSSVDGDDRAHRFRQTLSAVFRRVQAEIEACLNDGIQRGEFRNDLPVAQLALIVLATVEGLMLVSKTERSSAPLKEGLPILQRLLRVD